MLFARRDVGAGLWAARPGPARGRGGALALAWRLQRGSVIGWSIGVFLLGLAYGSLGNDVEDLVGSSDATAEVLQAQADLTAAFFAFAILMMALISAGFAISSALRPQGEEDAGRVETMLATALPRRAWLLGHVSVTVVGTAIVLTAGALGLGLGFALVTGDGAAFGRYLEAMAPYVAPVLLLAALARLLHGVVPRLAFLAWIGLAVCAVVMFFGQLLNFPGWLIDVSPFSHLAYTPAEDAQWAPVLVVALVALVLSIVGQVAFRRRDVITN